jgi:hypothetical protein
MGQQKIRNATKVEVDGIKFDSKLEAYFYEIIHPLDITLKIHECKFTILPQFTDNSTGKSYKAMTYTPDFVVTVEDIDSYSMYIIECKGFPSDQWKLREKLFRYTLSRDQLLGIDDEGQFNYDTYRIEFVVIESKKDADVFVNLLHNAYTNYDIEEQTDIMRQYNTYKDEQKKTKAAKKRAKAKVNKQINKA